MQLPSLRCPLFFLILQAHGCRQQTACLDEADPKMMANCIKLDMDCAQICELTAAFISRGSAHADHIKKECAEICKKCAEECGKHNNEHCKACAEACKKCAEACA